MISSLDKFCDICNSLSEKQKSILPLCAAENAISPFCKIPLDSFIQEKYIMGGILSYDDNNNFIEGKDLFQFYELLNDQCKRLFGCTYADPRALSGVNAVMVLLMSLFQAGDTILISSEDSGGHSSMPLICQRLGINTIPIPFDYKKMDFDYPVANSYIRKQRINGVLVCPSDIICQPDLYKLSLPPDCILIYDATQTLGLIATRANANPLDWYSSSDQFVLMGATHKTLPGPTCGLIMTKNPKLAQRFDTKINPDYLRNVQFHQILSLILALAEIENFGQAYNQRIIDNVNMLGKKLENKGMQVIHCLKENNYSETHQLLISMEANTIHKYITRCTELGVTLNARFKKLYRNSGIRIGVQEISRYGWSHNEINLLSEILWELTLPSADITLIQKKIESLSSHKHIQYTFSKDEYKRIYHSLHYSEL